MKKLSIRNPKTDDSIVGVKELCLNSSYIRYNKLIAKFLSVNSAVMVGILWELENIASRRGEDEFIRNGEWFTATKGYVEAFSSLTAQEQRKATLELERVGFISKRNFVGNRTQYKIHWGVIFEKVGEWKRVVKGTGWKGIDQYLIDELEGIGGIDDGYEL